jgi:3-demethylubiquinone-9 3-methyltransferase
MQRLTPHLWFDKEAKEAAEFYTSVFASYDGAESKIKSVKVLHNTPSGPLTRRMAFRPFGTLSLQGEGWVPSVHHKRVESISDRDENMLAAIYQIRLRGIRDIADAGMPERLSV